MEPLKNFKEMLERYRGMGCRKRAVIVCPDDSHVEYVIRRCHDEKLVDLTLVLDGGESPDLSEYCRKNAGDRLMTVSCHDAVEAARIGVRLVREGKGDVLMKGSLSTDVILHAVIAKDSGKGLLEPDTVMSHLAIVETPVYKKLLMCSDVAVIPAPDILQFDAIIRHDIAVLKTLGRDKPKIALIHFTEKMNPRFQICNDYKVLLDKAAAGCFGDAVVGGPMDVKTACDSRSAELKHIDSPVTGDADLVIFPDLEAGNTFYKTVSFFGGAMMAGLITGTTRPVVVASRADSALSKFYSLILACLTA